MPTADDPPRPTRRALGRGPGIRPAKASVDAEGPAGPPRAPADLHGSPADPVAPAAPQEASEGPTAPAAPQEASEGPTAPAAPQEASEGPTAPAALQEASEGPTAPADLHDASAGPAGSAAAPAGLVAPSVDPSSRSAAAAEAPGAPEAQVDAPGAVGSAPGENRAGEASAVPEAGDDRRFTVRLVNFEGPFDLLLQLISKHKLDVTEVALSRVTDEFMAHIRAMGPDWDLDQTTEFLVVAATLLDLKAARLLPTAEVEDEADLALLEARDLLFARLLQYRAYKRIAEIFSDRLESESRRHPRTVGLEPQHAELLPEVVISIGPEGFARLAVKAMQPKPKPQVYVDHIHAPLVSVREQAEIVVSRLRAEGEISFRELTEDAADTLTVVARFLALLELYREKAVALDQEEALGELMVRWAGGEGAEPLVTDEFDQEVHEAEEDVRE
ncbi:segregation/condensation protein A [Streptomyces sp. NBC_00059]|uniref:segregation/condensation protein A n=1 Tax=Streptomyces sp. NBC_00059 TaxID=2975635 RepID=UPI0022527808|nr:segregation/condensation protein A [Streptomyces sp. NBC_00059]MCX5413508.1 segregation/condensation protein A [Streptomyces sp. NBC_00059]